MAPCLPFEPPPPTVTVEVLDLRLAAFECHVDDRFARLDRKIDTTTARLDAASSRATTKALPEILLHIGLWSAPLGAVVAFAR